MNEPAINQFGDCDVEVKMPDVVTVPLSHYVAVASVYYGDRDNPRFGPDQDPVMSGNVSMPGWMWERLAAAYYGNEANLYERRVKIEEDVAKQAAAADDRKTSDELAILLNQPHVGFQGMGRNKVKVNSDGSHDDEQDTTAQGQDGSREDH